MPYNYTCDGDVANQAGPPSYVDAFKGTVLMQAPLKSMLIFCLKWLSINSHEVQSISCPFELFL